MFDLLIKNALIYDGSGAPAFYGDVGVTGGKIAAVGKDLPERAERIVEADGLSLAPGFIDCHSHSDQSLCADPLRLHVLRMGVTTEISGQCGSSVSPASDNMTEDTRAFQSKKFSPLFVTMAEQLDAMKDWELGPNQRFFTGHGLLRAGAMQLEARPAGAEELKVMQDALTDYCKFIMDLVKT